jgi:multiple sugar transport system substrate-binding protein
MTDSVPEKLGKYRIIEEVGRGGFAAVYKAVDTTLDRTVALKVLAPHLLWDPTFVQRFQQEAKVAANLDHANIVTIHEVGQIEGVYFIAMQFLAGRTLSQILEAEGSLPISQVQAIIEQVAAALDYAHARGFVHRDIKSSNVIVADDGRATLTDFGLVKAGEGTKLSTTGVVFGTPEYMSPEQAEGKELDARSDIYSLGVVIYEMLAGRAPFVADTTPAVMYKHVHEPPPLEELPSDLPQGVVAVVEKALAKKREERYQRAGEIAQALKEATEARVKVTSTPPEPKLPVPPPVVEKPLPEKVVPPLVEPAAVAKEKPKPLTPRAAPKKALGMGAFLAGGLVLLCIVGTVIYAISSWLSTKPTPEVIIVETVVVEREVEKEVPVEVTRVVEVEKEVPVEVEVTAEPVEKTTVEFWTTDNEEERVAVYEAVAARFMAEHPEIEVRIVPIEESGVSQRIATALAANRLPDIVRMGVERVATFTADGVLDEDAAEAVIASIGEDDFRVGPLAMVINPATGKRAAVPYDGWIQAIWYRADMFEEAGLYPPISWDDINAACEILPGTGNLLYALTLPTDPGQNYPHQVFEQVAMSNNAWPFDAAGNVTMNTPEMVEALRFYSGLQRCAMPGPQYWRGAREAYELDQSGMLFYSTYIMDDLVEGSGLEGGGRVEIAIGDLALRTGFASEMKGPNGFASYGQLVTLGIMEGADPEAQMVVKYFLTEGYIDVLALSPFGKVPVLKSAVDGWSELSPFFAYYSDGTLNQIANGYDSMQRWLFRPDYDATQRAVIGDIEGRLLIPRAISAIALEGTMTPETAAEWLQEQVEVLLTERQAE